MSANVHNCKFCSIHSTHKAHNFAHNGLPKAKNKGKVLSVLKNIQNISIKKHLILIGVHLVIHQMVKSHAGHVQQSFLSRKFRIQMSSSFHV